MPEGAQPEEANRTAPEASTEADQKAAYKLLLCEPHALFERCKAHAATRELSDAGAADMLQLLDWVLRVGEEAAIRWLLPIDDVLPRTPLFDAAMSIFVFLGACRGLNRSVASDVQLPDGWRLPPALHDVRAELPSDLTMVRLRMQVYQIWSVRAPEIALRCASCIQGAPAEDQRLAMASFEGLVNKVSVQMLGRRVLDFEDFAIPLFVQIMNQPVQNHVGVGQQACKLLRSKLAAAL